LNKEVVSKARENLFSRKGAKPAKSDNTFFLCELCAFARHKNTFETAQVLTSFVIAYDS
jgi:hypothetical protein